MYILSKFHCMYWYRYVHTHIHTVPNIRTYKLENRKHTSFKMETTFL